MTKTLPLLLLLLLPSLGSAQDLNGLVTGVESLPPERGGPGIDPSKLTEYLRAVEAADLALQVNARGQTREALGVSSLNVEASWADTGAGSPTLTSLTVRPGTPEYWSGLRALPAGAGTVRVAGLPAIQATEVRQGKDYVEVREGGRRRTRFYPDGKVRRSNGRGYRTVREPDRLGGRLNSVTFANGVMKLDIDGSPDLTVEKVSWERNGDGQRVMRMHVNFWPDLIVQPDGTVEVNAFGGIEVGKLEALTRLERWPPSMEDLQKAFSGQAGGEGLTGHDLDVHYRLTGRARPQPFPFTSLMEAGANFDVRGAVALRPDGSLTTIGDGNTLKVDLRIGEQDFLLGRLPTSTHLEGRTRASSATLQGTYAIAIPARGGQVDLRVDGDLAYQLEGDRLLLSLPSGTQVGLGNGRIAGTTGLGLRIHGGQTDVALRDGRYDLAIDGPIRLEKLVMEKLRAEELDLDGRLESQGTFSSESGGALQVQGGVHGTVTVAEGAEPRAGAVDVLLNSFQGGGKLVPGSTAAVNLEQVTLTTDPLQPDRPTRFRSLEVEGGKVTAQTTLRDARFQAPGGTSGELGAVRADVDLTVDAITGEGLRSLRGTVDTEVLERGTVTLDGLPGRPVLPSAGQGGTASTEVVTGTQTQPVTETPVTGTQTQPVTETPVAGTQTQAVDLAVVPEPTEDAAPRREVAEVVHQVRGGDTLWGLGQAYGVSPAAIKRANGLTSDTIVRGNSLRIPVAGSGAPTTSRRPQPRPTDSIAPGDVQIVDAPAVTAPAVTAPAPRTGRVVQEVLPGSKARLEIDNARQVDGNIEIDGHVTTQLVLGAADVRVGAIEAKILGEAQASVARTGFTWRGGQPHSLRMGRVQVPVRIQIQKGSRVQVDLPKFPVEVEMDREGSYAEFVAHVVLTADGARLDEITDADLYLESSGMAVVAGRVAEVPGEKMIHFKGRLVILRDGIDFYGEITVRVRGSDDEPIVKIRW